MTAAIPLRVVVLGEGEIHAGRSDADSGLTWKLRRLPWPAACEGYPSLEGTDVVIGMMTTPAACELAIGRIRAGRPQVPTLALLAPDVPEALLEEAATLADDFMLSPVRVGELQARLLRLAPAGAAPARATARRLAREMGLRELVGEDPAIRRLVAGIARMAASDATVLITGETGTGKELYARALHQMGARREQPFIAVDCAACPEQLFENELFGHARGAFTDAREEHRGLVAMAERGVLLLDEVDALSLPAQGKLLRFLQEKTFKPLGSERVQHADVRVLAATNRNLVQLVKEQRFRSDLLYRLSVLPVHLPPLRERRGDIPLLAGHFLARATPTGVTRMSDRALAALGGYDFPGNVRELANIIQRAMVMAEGPCIEEVDLLFISGEPGARRPPGPAVIGSSFRQAKAQAIAEFERTLVASLLAKHGGNVTQASREARQDRRAFGRLVKKYRLGGWT
jgi:DNA-binding NtrC family response regulator